MYCNRPHTCWSTQSRLAALLFSLIACQLVRIRTLWRLWLKDSSIDEMVGAWCFSYLSGPPRFTCWISFAPVFSFIYCESLSLLYLLFYSLIYMFWEMSHWLVRDLSCKPNIYVSWSTSKFRVRLALWKRFKPSSQIFYWQFQGGTSFVDFYVFFLSCGCYASCASVYICLVDTRREKAGLLAVVCGV